MAWAWCLDPVTNGKKCNSTHIEVLQTYMSNFTTMIKQYPKTKGQKEGGYFTTCAEHIFYKTDHYSKYKNNGVTVDDAIWNWWKTLDNPSPRWYWPCEINSLDTPQC